MGKYQIKIMGLILVSSLIFGGCTRNDSMPELTTHLGTYLGSEYKGNYVWGGAMNLAWTELNENILHEKLKLKTNDIVALKMVDAFNNPVFSKKDLDEKSYYVKSGSGQETLKSINAESKAKFPSKSFGDLSMPLSPTDFISYAYFLKEIEYIRAFDQKSIWFGWHYVEGFYAKTKEQKANVNIIHYENNDKFIVSLRLKDEQDNIFLAKGYDMDDPENVVNSINKDGQTIESMDDSDTFAAPKLHLDHHREYTELTQKPFANKGFEQYSIAQMFENIKFDMDEKGARVENEAVISMTLGMSLASPEPKKPKNLLLNKPYWLIMQRRDSKNPYFILGVKNTELMR